MMRNWTRTALALTASVAFGLPAMAQVKVGSIESQSGPVASIGVPYVKGMSAFAAGGGLNVGGTKMEVIAIDDQSDPAVAARAAKKLIEEDKVDVLIGSAGTPSTMAIYGVAAEAHVPLLFAANGQIPGPKGEWEITLPQPANLMVAQVVKHMKAHGVKRVAFIGYSDAWGDTVYDALKANATPLGIEVISNERYARADTSVTPQILKIIAMHPDAVMTGGSGSPGALPHLALAERGYRGPMYASHAVINLEFVRVGGAAVEGVIAPAGPIVVGDQLPDSNPIKAVDMKYFADYTKATSSTANDSFAAYTYDGMLILADAVKRVAATGQKPGTPEYRTALRDALVSTKNVVGTHGVYNFTPGERYGADDRSGVLVQLVKGQWKLIQ